MSFAGDLAKFKDNALKVTERTRRAIVIELFSSVILDTPVDTGRLRGNWQASIGTPARGTIEYGELSITGAIDGVRRNLGSGDVTNYLTNNLPYAERIEYGYSNQAPEGMVRKNTIRMKAIVREQIRKSKNGVI